MGAFMFLIGVFIVWIEVDEFKMEKELQEFEEEEKKKEAADSKRTEEAKIRAEVISPKMVISESEESKAKTSVKEKGKLHCSKCKKDFDTERGYKIHMSRVHGK